ncbi:hypothetical protein PLAN_160189 [Planktothrix rubescens CCAP 1459/22]|uniref:Uncharacterized protein n=1 Tax=Planktothrix rubescens CCAP 1459/22 TaxID=329571 RepID=A0A6J7ZJN9_PLARU|nr:hypothetical protein PLAN_160189 [Planktothrix rubescens NIVA-CYA 18]
MSFQTDIAGNTGTAPPNPPCTGGLGAGNRGEILHRLGSKIRQVS